MSISGTSNFLNVTSGKNIFVYDLSSKGPSDMLSITRNDPNKLKQNLSEIFSNLTETSNLFLNYLNTSNNNHLMKMINQQSFNEVNTLMVPGPRPVDFKKSTNSGKYFQTSFVSQKHCRRCRKIQFKDRGMSSCHWCSCLPDNDHRSMLNSMNEAPNLFNWRNNGEKSYQLFSLKSARLTENDSQNSFVMFPLISKKPLVKTYYKVFQEMRRSLTHWSHKVLSIGKSLYYGDNDNIRQIRILLNKQKVQLTNCESLNLEKLLTFTMLHYKDQVIFHNIVDQCFYSMNLVNQITVRLFDQNQSYQSNFRGIDTNSVQINMDVILCMCKFNSEQFVYATDKGQLFLADFSGESSPRGMIFETSEPIRQIKSNKTNNCILATNSEVFWVKKSGNEIIVKTIHSFNGPLNLPEIVTEKPEIHIGIYYNFLFVYKLGHSIVSVYEIKKQNFKLMKNFALPGAQKKIIISFIVNNMLDQIIFLQKSLDEQDQYCLDIRNIFNFLKW